MSLLVTKDLRKNFGDTKAVDGVDLTISEGEFVSLIGANGAGKTTLVNLISGYFRPSGGKIFFLGHNINSWTRQQRVKGGIARSFQLVNLFDDLVARSNLAMAIFSREGKALRLSKLAEKDEQTQSEALEVLQLFGLRDKAELRAGELSHGERKLLDVAVAYCQRPKFLLLDEPTSGVSSQEKTQIMDTICDVVRADRITAAIVEHDMDVVFKYSRRIVAMHEGNIIADGSPQDIQNNRDVAENLLGGLAPQ